MNWRYVATIIICICSMLMACAGKTDEKNLTLYFISNANNVLVTMDNKTCYIPCKIDVESDMSHDAIVSYDSEFSFNMKTNEARLEKPTDGLAGSFLIDPQYEHYPAFIGVYIVLGGSSGAGIVLLPLTSAYWAVTTSGATTVDAISSLEPMEALRYDTNSYYIYLRGTADASKWTLNSDNIANIKRPYESELIRYAIGNFDTMQSELFNIEQPHIAAFTELSGVTNINELLFASEDAIVFLDKVTLERTKLILDSNMEYSEKMAALSALLWYDEAALAEIYTDDTMLFLEKISDYLNAKRVINE